MPTAEELAEQLAPAKAKRKKTASPTARTLAECRKRGWIAQVVERPWNKFAKVKLDLFGVIDIVAIVPSSNGLTSGAILGIQACSGGRSGEGGRGSDHAARRTKILAEPRAKAWIDAGGALELWSWSRAGARGQRKLWTLRIETYAEMQGAAT